MFSSLFKFAILAAAASSVMGESHTITMNNHCGSGTPTLIQGGVVRHSGTGSFTAGGAFPGAIAYLQTGGCGSNGENCMLVEITLKNPTTPGSGSSVDLSLIPPHAFNVAASFHYTNGCSNGASCGSASCPSTSAFHVSTDTQAQRACQANDAGLVIDFC